MLFRRVSRLASETTAQTAVAGASQSVRMLVTQAVKYAVVFIKPRSDYVHVLGITTVVPAKEGIGNMIGELHQA